MSARPQRLTRRFPAAMSEEGYRRLRAFAAEAGLSEGEALSFVFENLGAVMHREKFPHRLRQHREMLAARGGEDGA
jgi:hypothetical protein